MTNTQTTTPKFSIVVPVMNEAGNILPLAAEVASIMHSVTGGYELIFVDDASRDSTVAEIKQAQSANPAVRLLRHEQNRGQSYGLHTGISAARGEFIITLDGDRQNPPAEIAKLITAMPAAPALVAGIRVKRQDSGSKRWASKWANKIRQAILHDDCPDTGCALKLFPRAVFMRLPFFNHMHRYLPVLFKLYGLQMVYVPVSHQPRVIGTSKYNNLQRALVGIYDLFGVRWLVARTKIVKSWEE